MKFGSVIILLFAITLSACESLITDIPASKLPQVGSKLVVQCFISPQSPRINVIVTESVPVFGDATGKGGVISNAIVTISDGVREAIIPYDSASQLYSLEGTLFTISPSKTYYLRVTDGNRTATANCTVPGKVVVPKSFVIDTSFSNNAFDGDTAITVKMTWDDIAVDTNFYRVRASMDLDYSVPEGLSAETFKEKRVRNRFNFNWDKTIGRNDFQSDGNLDGASFTSPIGRATLPQAITYDYGNGNKFTVYPKSKIALISMEIYNTDENYFRYHRSLEMRGNSDNPFIEPTLIFTNMKDGLGCFAAYNSGSLVYRP